MRMSSVCSWPLKQCYLSTKYCTGILVENIIYFRILSDLLLPIFGISFPAHHIGVFKNELSHMLPEHGHRSWSSTMCSVKTTFLGSIHFSGSKWTCTTISQAFAWVDLPGQQGFSQDKETNVSFTQGGLQRPKFLHTVQWRLLEHLCIPGLW